MYGEILCFCKVLKIVRKDFRPGYFLPENIYRRQGSWVRKNHKVLELIAVKSLVMMNVDPSSAGTTVRILWRIA